jgi:arginase
MSDRTFHILGAPLRSGSWMPGTESDAPAYREAGLLERLRAAGIRAVDEGDLAVPSYVPHHTVPPFRNWPGPRIVWDLLADRVGPMLREDGHVPLLVGCDCSVVVGTAQALGGAADDVHVLYIDGDFDDAPPDPGRCQSAAAMAVWLLTHPSPFWPGPVLRPSQVTVLGWSKAPVCPEAGVRSASLEDMRRAGAARIVREALAAIPASASILTHFDIDVVADGELPAAHFSASGRPHDGATAGSARPGAAGRSGPAHRDQRVLGAARPGADGGAEAHRRGDGRVGGRNWPPMNADKKGHHIKTA